MRNHYLSASIVLLLVMANATPALAQSVKDQNARALKPYLATRQISTLEWELLQTNLVWQGSYNGNVDYLTSYPVSFDPRAMRFRTTFFLKEKRYRDDPEPFFSLPKPKREAILRGAVDTLVKLLAPPFPEIKSNPSLIYVEFWLSGSESVVAKYENGLLSFSE